MLIGRFHCSSNTHISRVLMSSNAMFGQSAGYNFENCYRGVARPTGSHVCFFLFDLTNSNKLMDKNKFDGLDYVLTRRRFKILSYFLIISNVVKYKPETITPFDDSYQ